MTFISNIYNSIVDYINARPVLSSAVHSFISGFLTALVILLKAVPTDTLANPSTWTWSFVGGIAYACIRAGVKSISPLS
jgi:uncharacterized membrane protein YdcZ (DUF606 family)